jgi:hypothetical protein
MQDKVEDTKGGIPKSDFESLFYLYLVIVTR